MKVNIKTAGYSGTPLAKKLGIKENFKIEVINQPDYYFDLFSELPESIKFFNNNITGGKGNEKKNLIHYFTKDFAEFREDILKLKAEIEPDGIIWISWPKKASKVPTDMTEDIVRNTALMNGLVDVKVCAIDEIWSGLKLVIPVRDRK